MQKICCVCAKTDSGSGWTWEPQVDYRRLSHGYCPDCYHGLLRRILALSDKGCQASQKGFAA